jgi:tripartite-type tricarboxylate transporter receptor subunit TctC
MNASHRFVLLSLLLSATPWSPAHAAERAYPAKPVRMIVPFPPGGGTDIVARYVALKMSDGLSQQVVIDNRGGVGGLIGTAIGVKAEPDGYTLTMIAAGYAMYQSLYKLDYDSAKDISPISMIGTSPSLVTVNPALPVKNIRELIAYAKANPGKLNYGSSGQGGNTHLTTELFNYMAKVNMTHIPYKGNAPAMTDLMAGQIQVLFGSMLTLRPQVKAGKLRGLAVTSAKRSTAMPDLPTVAESGVPGYEASSWYAIIGPARMGKPVVDRLNAELKRVVSQPDFEERLSSEGLEPLHTTPDEFGRYLSREIAKWSTLVKAAHITAN